MPFQAAVLRELQIDEDECFDALAPEASATILKHAVKIFARDHGLAEDDMSCLADRVLSFASAAILDQKRQGQAVA